MQWQGKPFTNFEVSLRLRFAYLENFLKQIFTVPVSEALIQSAKSISVEGFAGVLKSSYNYTKISASISDYIKIPPFGNISFWVYAGKTFGTLPYILLDIAPGNELYYYNKYAFNMMNR